MICTATPDWLWALVAWTSLSVMFFVDEKKRKSWKKKRKRKDTFIFLASVKFSFLLRFLRSVYCKQPRGLYIFATDIVSSTIFKNFKTFLRFRLLLIIIIIIIIIISFLINSMFLKKKKKPKKILIKCWWCNTIYYKADYI